MKLLIVITDLGSFNNFIAELATSFTSDSKNELHVICSREKVIDVEGRVNSFDSSVFFHFIDIPRGFHLFRLITASIKISNEIDLIKPDLIHIHFTTAAFPALLFRRFKKSYWTTFHGLGMNSTSGIKRIVFSLVELFCLIRSDKVFVLNNEDYSFLRAIPFIQEKVNKYNSIGVGCNIEKFNSTNKDFAFYKAFCIENNISEKHVILSFTGRFVSFKGFNLVIKILNKLNHLKPGKYKLLLIGGYDPIHSSGLSNYEKAYVESSLDIIKVGFTNEVQKYLALTDIFLFPSKKEGLPVCILEALSMGIPVVTFNARGNNDIVINNYNGQLISTQKNQSQEINDFASKIELLSNNKRLKDEMISNALKDRNKYSRQNFIEESLNFYSDFKSI
jgi:glycosyltransferase involved in cell wall biosynthesis